MVNRKTKQKKRTYQNRIKKQNRKKNKTRNKSRKRRKSMSRINKKDGGFWPFGKKDEMKDDVVVASKNAMGLAKNQGSNFKKIGQIKVQKKALNMKKKNYENNCTKLSKVFEANKDIMEEKGLSKLSEKLKKVVGDNIFKNQNFKIDGISAKALEDGEKAQVDAHKTAKEEHKKAISKLATEKETKRKEFAAVKESAAAAVKEAATSAMKESATATKVKEAAASTMKEAAVAAVKKAAATASKSGNKS